MPPDRLREIQRFEPFAFEGILLFQESAFLLALSIYLLELMVKEKGDFVKSGLVAIAPPFVVTT